LHADLKFLYVLHENVYRQIDMTKIGEKFCFFVNIKDKKFLD